MSQMKIYEECSHCYSNVRVISNNTQNFHFQLSHICNPNIPVDLLKITQVAQNANTEHCLIQASCSRLQDFSLLFSTFEIFNTFTSFLSKPGKYLWILSLLCKCILSYPISFFLQGVITYQLRAVMGVAIHLNMYTCLHTGDQWKLTHLLYARCNWIQVAPYCK